MQFEYRRPEILLGQRVQQQVFNAETGRPISTVHAGDDIQSIKIAKLFAAAPEMLSALRAILAVSSRHSTPEMNVITDAAKIAIGHVDNP